MAVVPKRPEEVIMIGSLLLFAALVCFVLVAFVSVKKINLVAFGLAFWVTPQVLARFI
jgi:uncharacterized membrane protein